MATQKPLYGSSSPFTVTALASLASDTNLLAGWQGAAVDNATSNLNCDEFLSGQIKVGSVAPTNGTTIEIWVYGNLDDTPTYPDTITGSQGAVTLTSLNTKNAGLRQAWTITVDATANRVYSFGPISILSVFGGPFLPKRWGPFITQATAQALGTTQVLTRTPVQMQSV